MAITTLAQVSLLSREIPGQEDPYSALGPLHVELLILPQQYPEVNTIFDSITDHGTGDRHIGDRLESSSGPSADTRDLVPRRHWTMYNCPRIGAIRLLYVAFPLS